MGSFSPINNPSKLYRRCGFRKFWVWVFTTEVVFVPVVVTDDVWLVMVYIGACVPALFGAVAHPENKTSARNKTMTKNKQPKKSFITSFIFSLRKMFQISVI